MRHQFVTAPSSVTAMSNVTRERPCCELMRQQLDCKCDQHSDRFECPDALIGTFADGCADLRRLRADRP
jgi:hypothetical protein